MEAIAKMHPVAGLPAPAVLAQHPVVHQWMAPHAGLLHRLQQAMQERGVNPSRCVVLLPYAQLRPLAQRLWQLAFAQGFAPRFETTRSWVAALGARADGPFDLRHDRALDLLSAQSLLTQTGQAAQVDLLAGHLVDAAWQLAPLAAARAPTLRDAWAQACREALAAPGSVASAQWEALVAQVALEWVRLSGYASDALFAAEVWQSVDAVLQVGGLNPDPLGEGLRDHWGDARWATVAWHHHEGAAAAPPVWHAHPCRDALDEARRSAACAVRHVQAGRFPLALVSSDRALTRQVQAQLQASGLNVRDETGWKLSTTPAAAFIMALLHAASWKASTDTVLAWLKLAPQTRATVDTLEAHLRQLGERDWGAAVRRLPATLTPAEEAVVDAAQALRTSLQGRAPLTDWLGRLRSALERCAYWPLLDGAAGALAGISPRAEGTAVLQCLQLDPAAPSRLHEAAQGMAWAQRPWSLAEFTAWVNQSLEGASWSPDYPAQEHVVLVPLSQLLARPFAAVVLCGCDEVRLAASVAPPGLWTRSQREILGLPAREQLDQVLRRAWSAALDNPPVDVLWRTSDDAGEPLLASALVQALALDVPAQPLEQAVLAARSVPLQLVPPPAPQAQRLPLERLSASGFDALRTCPYRFFALRLLGLQSADELDQEVDKRDFGLWLHEVLSHFHRNLGADAQAPQRYPALLDAAADAVTRSQGLAQAEFLPYRASWPAVRDHYLAWLRAHSEQGFAFVASELDRERVWAGVTLHGRLDRMDRHNDGGVQVLDYKTESGGRTRERVADPLEDTQMAFYGALVQAEGDEPPAGSYLALGESECKEYAQPDMALAVQALLDGIACDVQRIRAGAALPALGEGEACTHCDARGLCRKDTWGGPAPSSSGELPA